MFFSLYLAAAIFLTFIQNDLKTTISINDIEVYAYHGYYEVERQVGQLYKLSIHVVIDTDSYKDDIDKTINYEELYTIIREEMAKPRLLLETIVESIANKVKEDYPFCLSGSLILIKPQPQLGGKVGSTSVQIDW